MCVFLGYSHGIKGYKVLDLDSNSVFISRDIVFYESNFPCASNSHPSTSYLNDFVFPHATSNVPCTTDFGSPLLSSITHDHSNSNDTSIPISLDAPNSAISIPDPTPLNDPNANTSIPNPISDYDSAIIPTNQPIQPQLRRSNRPYIPPSYLSDYSCKFVSAKPQSDLPYTISDFLSYSHLGPSFKSFVLVVSATPSEPASFHQAVQYPEWMAAMDKEIEALEVNNT